MSEVAESTGSAADNVADVEVDLITEVHEADARAVWSVTDRVFGDHASYESWWSATWTRHATCEGFRLARARAGEGGEPELVGFAYGYTGQPRQWWTDRAAEVLGPDVSAAWLGGHFEVITLALLPGHRRRGIGDRLLSALTDGLSHTRRVLMTSDDPDDPARRLYARHGFQVIGPGLLPDQVILGWDPVSADR